MKVLLVDHSSVLPANRDRARALARLPGMEVALLTVTRWQEPSMGLTRVLEPSPSEPFPVFAFPALWPRHQACYWQPRALARVLATFPADLVHVTEEPCSLAVYTILRGAVRRRIPVVVTSWQNLPKTFPWPFSCFERYCYRHAARVVAGGVTVRETLVRKGYDRPIPLTPLSVDTDRFSPVPRDRLPDHWRSTVFRVGYCGRLVREKGVEILLRASSRLPFPHAILLNGCGGHEAALHKEIAALGIDSRVTFLNSPPGELPDFYRALDALVVPSLSLPGWREQFSRVLVEAQACGIPAVGSESGEIPHTLGAASGAGLLFPEGDDKALADHLAWLHDHPAEARALGARGLAHAREKFSAASVARSLAVLYREVLEYRRPVTKALP